MTPLTGQYSLT